MSLTIKVEKIKLLPIGNYQAVVRATRYEDRPKTLKAGGELIKLTETVKAGAEAEFIVEVWPKRKRERKKKSRVEEGKDDAKLAVINFCREVIKSLEG